VIGAGAAGGTVGAGAGFSFPHATNKKTQNRINFFIGFPFPVKSKPSAAWLRFSGYQTIVKQMRGLPLSLSHHRGHRTQIVGREMRIPREYFSTHAEYPAHDLGIHPFPKHHGRAGVPPVVPARFYPSLGLASPPCRFIAVLGL
jgi:hypothetical protein